MARELCQAVKHGHGQDTERQPLRGENRKAAEKRAELDRKAQARDVATVCHLCKEQFESPSKRDLHILEKHVPTSPADET